MADTPLLALDIDSNAPGALFVQLYEALRERIVSAQLKPGDRLPASRKLAEELGISRATVTTAYEQLIAEGFAHSITGSGVYISNIGEIEQFAAHTSAQQQYADAGISKTTFQPFHPGQPDARLFPYRQWGKCVAHIARTQPAALVKTDDLFGDSALRSEICRYLLDWRGLKSRPAQILITAGASEALEHCIRTLTQQGDRIYLEDPCYPPLRAFVQNLGIPISQLEMDPQGALAPETDNPASSTKLAVLTPSSQFPLGGALPHARRNAFISWAKQTQGWIIEDDYDSEFRYAGKPIPSLAGLDSNHRTIYIGSFAKIFSSGLRLGFVVLPESLIAGFVDSIKKFGSKASCMPQRPLAQFMRNGDYYRHIRRVRRIYAERRQAFIQLLNHYLGERVSFEDHKAGMHIAVKLPSLLKDAEIAEKLAQQGITCLPLSSYYASNSNTSQNGLLMGFCGFTESEMEQSMLQVKQVIEAMWTADSC